MKPYRDYAGIAVCGMLLILNSLVDFSVALYFNEELHWLEQAFLGFLGFWTFVLGMWLLTCVNDKGER